MRRVGRVLVLVVMATLAPACGGRVTFLFPSDAGPTTDSTAPACVETKALRIATGVHSPLGWYDGVFGAPDGAGGMIVVWSSLPEPAYTLPDHVFGQRVTPEGRAWNNGQPLPLLSGNGAEVVLAPPAPTVAMDPFPGDAIAIGSPGFHLAWNDWSADPDGDLYLGKFGVDGLPVGAPVPLDTEPGPAWGLSVLPDGLGGVLVFQDTAHPLFLGTSAVLVHHYDTNTVPVWNGGITTLDDAPAWVRARSTDWRGGYWEGDEVTLPLGNLHVAYHRLADGTDAYPVGAPVADSEHCHIYFRDVVARDGLFVVLGQYPPQKCPPDDVFATYTLQFVDDTEGSKLPGDGVSLFPEELGPVRIRHFGATVRPDGMFLFAYRTFGMKDEPCWAQVISETGKRLWSEDRPIALAADLFCRRGVLSGDFLGNRYVWHENDTMTAVALLSSEGTPYAARLDDELTPLWSDTGTAALADCPTAIDDRYHVVTDGVGGAYVLWVFYNEDPLAGFDLWVSHVDAFGNVGFTAK